MPDGLSEELRSIGRQIDVEPRAGLADRVMAGIERPERRKQPWLSWRTVATFATALLVVVAITAVASPPVRAAIRQIFFGVEVRHGPAPAPAPSPSLPGEQRSTVSKAGKIVGFAVRVPTQLGDPDLVTVADGRVVSLVWHRSGGDVRLDEFVGNLGLMWEKYTAMTGSDVKVNGQRALWFDGPLTLTYVDAKGAFHDESTRLTGNTLVWTDGLVTLRLDGISSEAEAVVVAQTAR